MQRLPRLVVAFTIFHASFSLLILPFVDSSQEGGKPIAGHTTHGDNIHKLSPKLLFEITLHGFLLWASIGFMMPVGILTIRLSNREECGRRLKILFYVHAILQIISVLVATTGAIMSIKNFNNSFNNHHQRIGVALYALIWLQALFGFARPHRGSKGRSIWFFVHWMIGTTVSLLGVINIYTGLEAYHEKTGRSIRIWTIIFTAEVSFIIFLYLIQDKWGYMQKQGVILGNEPIRPTDQEISPREKTKESMADDQHC